MSKQNDNPGVVAPPPLIFLGGLLIGGAIGWMYPYPFLPRVLGYVFGAVLAIVGLTTIISVRLKMAGVKTNIEPWKPTTAILSDGIYSISRNPVYVAMVIIYLGVVLIFNSLLMLIPLGLVLIAINFGVILREEKYLEQKFGAEYVDYKTKVRRWI